MTAMELLTSLYERGFTLTAGNGETLALAPKSRVTIELREMVRTHKQELLKLLRPQNFDDVKAGVRRLERELAKDSDLTVFLLVVQHQGDAGPPPDLEARLTDQVQARGLTGRLCLVVHSPLYQCELWQNGHAH